MTIHLKRAYDDADEDDGYRVLVDRLWPRGVSKEKARLDAWMREVAPSDELRRWFSHDPQKWDVFRERYAAELADKGDVLVELRLRAEQGTLTLVYAAKDREHNNAVALREMLEQRG